MASKECVFLEDADNETPSFLYDHEKSLAVVIDQNSQRPIGIAFTIVSAIRR